ncbi:hypothetical protein V8E55_005275 [Tylopilus felleus]
MSANQVISLNGPLYGSLFFASVMSTAFYGIACMQTFFYYVHYHDDPLRTKILVAILWTLNTIHESFTVCGVYEFIMAGLANPSSLVIGNPELISLYILTALVAVPTQGYFVYRLYVFSGKNIIVPIVWVGLALVQLVCPIVYVAKVLHTAKGVHVVAIGHLNSSGIMIIPTLTLSFSVAAAVDILIAIFMTFLLLRQRTVIGFANTVQLLQRLTVLAVNTGIWTATFALLSIILLHLFPSNMIYAVFSFPICSVYCNTLLANLNGRAYLRGEETVQMDMFKTSSLRVPNSTSNDQQHGQVMLISSAPQGAWKTTEVVRFPEDSRSTAAGDV